MSANGIAWQGTASGNPISRCGRDVGDRFPPHRSKPEPVQNHPRDWASWNVSELIQRAALAASNGKPRRRSPISCSDIETSGKPTTAPTGAPEKRPAWCRRAASERRTRASGNRRSRMLAKSDPHSTRVRSRSLTPRASNALVKTPVPGPSSITNPVSEEISEVIRWASAELEGRMEPTRRGLASHARRKGPTSRLLTLGPWTFEE